MIGVRDLDLDPLPVPARPAPRFLLAHPKGDSDETLKSRAAFARAALDAVCKGRPYVLVLGRDFFEERFKACGSWEAWIAEIVTGISYTTRRAIFDGILVPAGAVGAGTARMIEKAIASGKPAFAFNGAGKSARITQIRCHDPRNWQGGWRMAVDGTL